MTVSNASPDFPFFCQFGRWFLFHGKESFEEESQPQPKSRRNVKKVKRPHKNSLCAAEIGFPLSCCAVCWCCAVRCRRQELVEINHRSTLPHCGYPVHQSSLCLVSGKMQKAADLLGLELELHCPVCLDAFSEQNWPSVGACGHSICVHCFEREIKNNPFIEGDLGACPVTCCVKENVFSKKTYCKNFALLKALETIEVMSHAVNRVVGHYVAENGDLKSRLEAIPPIKDSVAVASKESPTGSDSSEMIDVDQHMKERNNGFQCRSPESDSQQSSNDDFKPHWRKRTKRRSFLDYPVSSSSDSSLELN